jgi:hypothetical protein
MCVNEKMKYKVISGFVYICANEKKKYRVISGSKKLGLAGADLQTKLLFAFLLREIKTKLVH